jgi:hypothetical protein
MHPAARRWNLSNTPRSETKGLNTGRPKSSLALNPLVVWLLQQPAQAPSFSNSMASMNTHSLNRHPSNSSTLLCSTGSNSSQPPRITAKGVQLNNTIILLLNYMLMSVARLGLRLAKIIRMPDG